MNRGDNIRFIDRPVPTPWPVLPDGLPGLLQRLYAARGVDGAGDGLAGARVVAHKRDDRSPVHTRFSRAEGFNVYPKISALKTLRPVGGRRDVDTTEDDAPADDRRRRRRLGQ